jgi:dihydrolipoamide dehydrogenase
MADYDFVVIGGGPAGYTAALKAAERGARVAVVEAERPGGACINHTCIPTNIMLSAATSFLETRELDVMGVFSVGETFNYGRAAARKDALAKQLADGTRAALRIAKVALIEGRAAFRSAEAISVTAGDGVQELAAQAFLIATGSRWEAPSIPGVAPERVLTADAVHRLAEAPKSALILGGGPADTAFGLEYAVLLTAAGAQVTIATPAARLLPGVDQTVAEVAVAALGDLGITVLTGAHVRGGPGMDVEVEHGGGSTTVEAELLVAADTRKPFVEGLNLEAAGLPASAPISVGRDCRTRVPRILAAGDVTGGVMLTNAASHMGEVAAINATGGAARTRLSAVPQLLHGVPEIAWIGMTEEAARAAGHEVATGIADLGYNARAMTLGARQGMVKVVAERELGEILGVHMVGPGGAEVLAAAATAMQAEVTVHDLAATVYWHPSLAEGLAEAARRALA